MKLTEKKLSSRLIYDGKILRLFLDGVELPDGKRAEREIIRHCGGAAVLFVRDGKVALVRQYRYAYGKEIYEIPAGKMDEGEDAQKAALRELEEETGYRASRAEHWLDLYPSPGYTDEIIHIYYVSEAVFVGSRLDEGEFLNVAFIPLAETEEMIARGEICDAKTVSAVYRLLSGEKGKD